MLKNNLIKLRALEPEDIDLLFNIENNTDLWTVSNTITPFSKYILTKYIENSHLDIFETKQMRFTIDSLEEKKTVGMIDLFDFDPFHNRAGIGIVILQEFRNKSFAENALNLIIEYSFNFLRLNQLYCNILTDNTVSLKLFEKFGFKITGTKKQWINVKGEFKDEYFLQLIQS